MQEVTTRLKACVRENDTVARFGGDEFVVVLGELDVSREVATEQTRTVAEKIQASLPAPQDKGIGSRVVEHHCSVGVGVVVFVSHEVSQNEVMKWADATMYAAKNAGRNGIHFYEKLN